MIIEYLESIGAIREGENRTTEYGVSLEEKREFSILLKNAKTYLDNHLDDVLKEMKDGNQDTYTWFVSEFRDGFGDELWFQEIEKMTKARSIKNYVLDIPSRGDDEFIDVAQSVPFTATDELGSYDEISQMGQYDGMDDGNYFDGYHDNLVVDGGSEFEQPQEASITIDKSHPKNFIKADMKLTKLPNDTRVVSVDDKTVFSCTPNVMKIRKGDILKPEYIKQAAYFASKGMAGQLITITPPDFLSDDEKEIFSMGFSNALKEFGVSPNLISVGADDIRGRDLQAQEEYYNSLGGPAAGAAQQADTVEPEKPADAPQPMDTAQPVDTVEPEQPEDTAQPSEPEPTQSSAAEEPEKVSLLEKMKQVNQDNSDNYFVLTVKLNRDNKIEYLPAIKTSSGGYESLYERDSYKIKSDVWDSVELPASPKDVMASNIQFALSAMEDPDNVTEYHIKEKFKKAPFSRMGVGFKEEDRGQFVYYFRGKNGEDRERYSLSDLGIILKNKKAPVMSNESEIEQANVKLDNNNSPDEPRLGEPMGVKFSEEKSIEKSTTIDKADNEPNKTDSIKTLGIKNN